MLLEHKSPCNWPMSERALARDRKRRRDTHKPHGRAAYEKNIHVFTLPPPTSAIRSHKPLDLKALLSSNWCANNSGGEFCPALSPHLRISSCDGENSARNQRSDRTWSGLSNRCYAPICRSIRYDSRSHPFDRPQVAPRHSNLP